MSKQSGSNRKWIVILVSIIVLLFALVTGGWFWGASRLEAAVNRQKQNLAAQGITANCNGQQVKGYPFRLGLFCDSISYADPIRNITASSSSLRSAAQLYRPGHVIAEMDGPLKLTIPGLAPMEVNWQNFQSSGRGNTSGLRRLSMIAQEATVSASDFGQLDLLATAQKVQFHALAGDEAGNASPADLEASIQMENWQIDDNGTGAIGKFDVRAGVLWSSGLQVLQSGIDPVEFLKSRGGEFPKSLIELKAENGGRLSLSGPLAVNPQGLVSGEVTVNMDEPVKLVDFAASIFPPIRAMAGNTIAYLDSLATSDNGKKEIRDLKLTIRDGKINFGFIQLGEIPPLF